MPSPEGVVSNVQWTEKQLSTEGSSYRKLRGGIHRVDPYDATDDTSGCRRSILGMFNE